MLVHISNSQLSISFPYALVLWEPFLNITEIPANLLCLPSPGGLQALHVRTLDFRRPQGDLTQGCSPRCRRLAVSWPETDGRAGFQQLSVVCSGHIYKAFHFPGILLSHTPKAACYTPWAHGLPSITASCFLLPAFITQFCVVVVHKPLGFSC